MIACCIAPDDGRHTEAPGWIEADDAADACLHQFGAEIGNERQDHRIARTRRARIPVAHIAGQNELAFEGQKAQEIFRPAGLFKKLAQFEIRKTMEVSAGQRDSLFGLCLDCLEVRIELQKLPNQMTSSGMSRRKR